jgi:hypothetical protein
LLVEAISYLHSNTSDILISLGWKFIGEPLLSEVYFANRQDIPPPVINPDED